MSSGCFLSSGVFCDSGESRLIGRQLSRLSLHIFLTANMSVFSNHNVELLIASVGNKASDGWARTFKKGCVAIAPHH